VSAGTIALRLVIGGDASGGKAALKSLGTESKKAQSGLGKGLKAAQQGAAIGLAAIVGVATKGVQSYEALTKSVAALQRQSKISAEDASLLTGQWQRYGVTAEAGGKGVMMLSKQIDAANIGTQTSIDSFARLGITLDDLKTMSPYQVLEQVRTTLSQMPAGAERTALSAKLLGRGFMSMSKWIAASSTDLDALNQQLKGTGQVMDEKELAKAKDDLKEMALLQVDLRGLLVEVGRSAMPIIRDMVPGLKKLLAVVKPLAPHLVEIGGALAAFLVVTKVAAGFGTLVTMLTKVKTLLVGGKIASGLSGLAGSGGIGTFVKDSRGKTVAQSLLSGGTNGPLEAAISLNTTATEANTLALGGKGALPGGGGGPVATVAKTAGMSAAAASGVTIGVFAGMSALPLVLARTQKAVDESMSVAEKRSVGSVGGGAFWGSSKGFHGGIGANRMRLAAEAKAEVDAAQAVVNAGGASIAQSLRASGDKAGAGLAAGLAHGVGPALQSIQRVRNSAGRPIHMGHLDATQMINEIARVSRAFGGVSSAARTAGNAAANAIRSPSGGGGSYRGHFMAAGGYVRRTPGGTLLRVGEGRYDEVVAQVLPGRGQQQSAGGETHFHFHVGQLVGTDERAARQLWNTVKPIAMSDMRMKMAMSRG